MPVVHYYSPAALLNEIADAVTRHSHTITAAAKLSGAIAKNTGRLRSKNPKPKNACIN